MSSLLQILSLLAIHWTAMGYKLRAHGIEGGHLDIRCPYPDRYQHLPKFVCRHPCWKKDVLIRGDKSDIYERSGRFSLYDNSQGHFFTVTIRELNLQDGALYYCGIETWGFDKMDKVQVTVSKAMDPAATLPPSAAGSDGNGSSFIRTPGMASTVHWTAMGYKLGAHGIEGGQLDIRCPYTDGYQHLPKYVCRHPCWKKDVIKGDKSDVYERSGRFSLYDNSLSRLFTVTIRELILQDGALYYCGIDTWGFDKMDKVQVTVSKAMDPAVTLPPSAAESDGKGRTSPHGSFIRTPGMASTDRTYLSNVSMETATPPLPFIYLDGNKGVTDSLVAIGSALGVLVCLFLAALAVQLKRSVSNPPALKPAGLSVPVDTVQGEEDPEPVYDECGEMIVYSTIGLPMENSEGLYSTVQFSDLPPGGR